MIVQGASEWSPTGLAILTILGGIVGALVTLFGQLFLDRYRAPNLQLSVDPGLPGCVVKTPTIDRDTSQISGHQVYFRVRVKNIGKNIARNVSADMIRVMFPNPASVTVFDTEVIGLKWALSGDALTNIPPGLHRFLDVCHTFQPSTGNAIIQLDTAVHPALLREFGLHKGKITVDIVAACDSARTAKASVSIDWQGDLDATLAV